MKTLFAAALLCALTPWAHAEGVKEKIEQRLSVVMPGQVPDSLQPAPLKGMYEAVYGPRIFYISEDARYVLSGELLDLETRVNLTETRRTQGRRDILAALDSSEMIIFPAKDKAKHRITVFTDIDCGYCRKLHNGMEEMNKLGIEVRYLAYPRAGVGSASYDKAVGVWCAEDRQKAITEAKTGKNVEKKTCENPVRKHLQLGQTMGVTGTPTLVLDNGEVLPGYLPPQKLLQALEE